MKIFTMFRSVRFASRKPVKFVFKFSTAASQPQPNLAVDNFRTSETNPLNHTAEHIGHFYNVTDTDKRIFLYGGLPKTYKQQVKTFTETCLMVRKPAVDIINCLNRIDLSKPAVRFVLFGDDGNGKSLAMAHVLHYGLKAGYILVHVPWVPNWMRKCKESGNSETKEGFINLNIDAAAWLVHFKSQNEHFLNDPKLNTSREYIWSKRESTPQGAPLLTLIDHGINRIKYASDCVVHLAKELKRLSNEDICKTMVVIDGFNSFFYPKTKIFTEKKELVHPSQVTITEAFLELTKFDWHNAVCILSVDQIAAVEEENKSYLPRYLLGKEGFEHLDPFVPVFVDAYTAKELTSCMSYYRERKWIQPVAGQDEEISILSANNPFKIMQLCSAL